MVTFSKKRIQKISVALNIIAAACSMLIGIPWLIRHNRDDHPLHPKSIPGKNTALLRHALTKLQNSGYSSLTADERELIADSMKSNK